MTTEKEERKERIELAKSVYEGNKEEWRDKFPILRKMSDKEAIRLIAKTIIKGVVRRWNE